MCIEVWRKSFRNPAAGYFSVIAHPGIGRSGRTFAQLQAPLATPDCGGWFKIVSQPSDELLCVQQVGVF